MTKMGCQSPNTPPFYSILSAIFASWAIVVTSVSWSGSSCWRRSRTLIWAYSRCCRTMLRTCSWVVDIALLAVARYLSTVLWRHRPVVVTTAVRCWRRCWEHEIYIYPLWATCLAIVCIICQYATHCEY